ncbi:class E sortase [Amycolatopsis pigmentata]|uniref:Class E sortase n=1 Tax=Amycolatopsis pigmentata TaxID=450801 RepID=A0ABW5FTS8_9PSEU
MAIGEQPPAPPSPGIATKVVRALGELLITAGLVVLLFVVYELYVTDLFSGRKQVAAAQSLDEEWAGARPRLGPVGDKAFAKLYIPALGTDYHYTVQEGVDAAALEVGPGHYPGTALPGEPGNFAVAGHRVGRGAPFDGLDNLRSCDAIVVETQSDFFVYRVLPHADEVAGWATGKGRQPRCSHVATLRTPASDGGPYGQTSGREIVSPSQGDVVAPVPHRPADVLPKSGQVALLTLTTCHPRFSDRQRLIVHAVLTNQFTKTPGTGYEQLLKAIGEEG